MPAKKNSLRFPKSKETLTAKVRKHQFLWGHSAHCADLIDKNWDNFRQATSTAEMGETIAVQEFAKAHHLSTYHVALTVINYFL